MKWKNRLKQMASLSSDILVAGYNTILMLKEQTNDNLSTIGIEKKFLGCLCRKFQIY